MRALLFLLPLTFSCILKNGYCGFEEFKNDTRVIPLLAQYHNKQITKEKFLEQLNNIGLGMHKSTLDRYLKQIKEADGGSRFNYKLFKKNPHAMALVAQQYNNSKMTKEQLLIELNKIEGIKMGIATLYRYLRKMEAEAGGGTPNFASASGNPGSSIPNEASAAGGGSRKNAFEKFKDNPAAMALVERYNNKEITDTALFEALKRIKPKMSIKSMYLYLDMLNEEKKAGSGAPNLQDTQIAGQSSNFTSDNPGSSTSALKKGKSTNFSKAPGSSSHQQAPPTDDTFVPSQAGTDSTNWFGGEQNDEGTLESMTRNPSLLKSALGAVSNLFGASPQEPQFSPPMHDTSAASSYYPSNQPDDQSLESLITPRNQKDASLYYGGAMPSQQVPPADDTFVPSQAGTDSTDWFVENLQSNDGDLESMIRKPSSSGGFDTTPFLPNQSQSLGLTGASNVFSPTPNTSNFNSGNPGSSSHYGGAMPHQQVSPMPDTSSFHNYPFNQSAPLNSSTNFGPSQPGTPSLDWSGGNSQNNDGDLASVVMPKKPSSSKGFDAPPFLPNQSQSTELWDFSNPAPPFIQAPQIAQQSSKFTSCNPGTSTSASNKGNHQLFERIDTALPNHPFNQSAPLNSSTNFGPSQAGTNSLDWSGVNSQNNAGTLESMINTRKPSSSKGTNETKTGKKPRN